MWKKDSEIMKTASEQKMKNAFFGAVRTEATVGQLQNTIDDHQVIS